VSLQRRSAFKAGAWSSSFDRLRMRTILGAGRQKNLILSLSKDEVFATRRAREAYSPWPSGLASFFSSPRKLSSSSRQTPTVMAESATLNTHGKCIRETSMKSTT